MRNKINIDPEQFPIAAVLNYGRQNAIKSSQLEQFFNVDRRTIGAQIERERRAGMPICASKNAETGGFYLPANEEEVEAYIAYIDKHIVAYTEIKYSLINNGYQQLYKNSPSSI